LGAERNAFHWVDYSLQKVKCQHNNLCLAFAADQKLYNKKRG
jgi:hypothetical protein